MATYTITPSAYYQVEDGYITAINPTIKEVALAGITGHKAVLIRYDLSEVAEYTHSAITQNMPAASDITFVTTGLNAIYYIFIYGEKLNDTPAIGDSVRMYGWNSSAYRIGEIEKTYSTGTITNHMINLLAKQGGYFNTSYFYVEVCEKNNGCASTFTSLSLTFTYTPITQLVYSVLPAGGYLNHTENNVFTFSNGNTQNTLLPFVVAEGAIKYKASSESEYTSIPFTGTSATIPANTLQDNTDYSIYADIEVTSGQTGATSEGNYTTVDTIGTTTGQTPNNSIEYGTVTFTWTYRNSTGTAQYAYDLDLSDDGTTYTTVLSHVVTSATTATYTVNTAGGKYWRVRGYNQNDVAGDYSAPLYFVNNIPPSPPVITNITGAGRLTVTWAADNQSAYEVEVYNGDTRVYDSTVVYTADTTHLINEYLPNGMYTIKVKTINIYGHESDYSTTVYSIANVGGINVTGSYENGTATLTYAGNYVLYYIQRDGVTIAKTTATTYNDLYMNGTAQYTVIGVNNDDSYAIGTATVSGTVPFTRFVDLDGNVYDISKRWLQRIGVQVSTEAEYDTALYLGAKRPAHTFGTGRIRRYAIAFTYEGDYTVFIGKVLRYMDIYGNADFVVVPNINEVEAMYGNELTASLEVTDYDEGITYDL